MATTIKVIVPEAYALDAQGKQLEKLVIKHARTQAEMEPQLSAFIEKWCHTACTGCGDEGIGFFSLCNSCLKELEEIVHSEG